MRKAGCLTFTEADLARRDFIRVGSLGFLGMSMSQYLHLSHLMGAEGSSAKKAKAQACILLWLEGGPSQVDTWDPKPNSSFKPIATNVAGVQISELFPRVAKKMDKLAIIRSMHTEENNHGLGTYYAMTGHRPSPAMKFPSLGSIISKELGPRNQIPAYVLAPGWPDEKHNEDNFKAAFLGAEHDPMVLPDRGAEGFEIPDLSLPKPVTLERLQDRRAVLQIIDRQYRQKVERAEFANMDSFQEQAMRMILSPGVREAFDLSKEPEKMKDAYGRSGFGQSVLLARRLVEAGSRFVTASGYYHNAWDAHSINDRHHRDTLVPPLDQALSVLLEDLEQRGLLDSTIVLAMGEFGRTPHHNPKLGRDHWPECWSLVLGGGGIRGGCVVGASDDRGAQVADRMVTIGDLFATIYKAMGINWEKEYPTPIGRPTKIANSIHDETGVPIQELI